MMPGKSGAGPGGKKQARLSARKVPSSKIRDMAQGLRTILPSENTSPPRQSIYKRVLNSQHLTLNYFTQLDPGPSVSVQYMSNTTRTKIERDLHSDTERKVSEARLHSSSRRKYSNAESLGLEEQLFLSHRKRSTGKLKQFLGSDIFTPEQFRPRRRVLAPKSNFRL